MFKNPKFYSSERQNYPSGMGGRWFFLPLSSVLTFIYRIGRVCLDLLYCRATLYTVSGTYSNTRLRYTSSFWKSNKEEYSQDSSQLFSPKDNRRPIARPKGRIIRVHFNAWFQITWIILAYERRHYKCNFFSHWLRPFLHELCRQIGPGVLHDHVIWNIMSYTNGLVQKRRNSSALAMELRLSCTN